ncbi:hypothetical protein EB796_005556 [Bugula neritina]|uniref:Uncharacterized protein n=1 Tax=Bugula neritina TaxID=10212 RepID=A0A7J7KET8_BUGNE|nr:hypothetical protein EB796_005556 [Bugula neritina]
MDTATDVTVANLRPHTFSETNWQQKPVVWQQGRFSWFTTPGFGFNNPGLNTCTPLLYVVLFGSSSLRIRLGTLLENGGRGGDGTSVLRCSEE